MIFEGIPTAILGMIAYMVFPHDPSEVVFLTERERSFFPIRRHIGKHSLGKPDEGKIDLEGSLSAFKGWKAWTMSFGQQSTTVAVYKYNTLLPTIISGLG